MSELLDDARVSARVFHPRKPSQPEEVEYTIVDCGGVKLYCYYEASSGGSLWAKLVNALYRATNKTVVFFHGNGELVENYASSEFKESLLASGFNVFLVEYRGYGLSDGRPAFTAMFEDLKYIHEYLVNKLGILPTDIITFGRSMGGLYATEYALRYPNIRALAVESTFADPMKLISQRVAADVEFAASLPKEQFEADVKKFINNAEKMARLNPELPVLIMHAADDPMIPKESAEANYAACASKKKKLVMYPIGQHNYFHAANSKAYDMEGVKYNSIFEELVVLSTL